MHMRMKSIDRRARRTLPPNYHHFLPMPTLFSTTITNYHLIHLFLPPSNSIVQVMGFERVTGLSIRHMNPGDSQNDIEESNRMEEPSHFEALQAVDMSLTKEQYMVIQHMLPKRYSLIEHRHIKKGGVVTSAIKLAPEDTQNLSRVSGNTEDVQGRTKRIRIKKTDKFLEETHRNKKQQIVTDIAVQDDLPFVSYVLQMLMKHKSAYLFNYPINPERDGVPNYFQVIKNPMDLTTVQDKYNRNEYKTAAQTHADINLIWSNSLLFNEKGLMIHKCTLDMERYHKALLTPEHYRKFLKSEKKRERGDERREDKSLGM